MPAHDLKQRILAFAYSDEKLTPFRPDVDTHSGDMLTPIPTGC
jgi:hypothetical protein